MDIRQPVRRLLRARGITQEQMALDLGTTPSSISRWLTGTVPVTVQRLEEIARYLGVPLWLILMEADEPDRDLSRWIDLYRKTGREKLAAAMLILEDPSDHKLC